MRSALKRRRVYFENELIVRAADTRIVQVLSQLCWLQRFDIKGVR